MGPGPTDAGDTSGRSRSVSRRAARRGLPEPPGPARPAVLACRLPKQRQGQSAVARCRPGCFALRPWGTTAGAQGRLGQGRSLLLQNRDNRAIEPLSWQPLEVDLAGSALAACRLVTPGDCDTTGRSRATTPGTAVRRPLRQGSRDWNLAGHWSGPNLPGLPPLSTPRLERSPHPCATERCLPAPSAGIDPSFAVLWPSSESARAR